MWYVASNPQRVTRVRIAPHSRFLPTAIIPLEGKALLSQFDRDIQLNPGAFAFMDGACPLVLDMLTTFQHLYLQFPITAFTPREFDNAAARLPDMDEIINRIFVNCASSLWKAAPDLGFEQHGAALNALLSLCTITTPFRHKSEELEIDRRVKKAVEFIECRLGNEYLNAQNVADAQSLSRRYLDELFGRYTGFRIEGWIWERRLKRAELQLRLPEARDRTLLQLALDLGFKSPSHFTRAFANRFGMVPKEYRRLHSGRMHEESH
jgi:AraC-like DNA-binding protein